MQKLWQVKRERRQVAKELKRWMQMPGWLVVTCAKSNIADAASIEDPMGLAREDYTASCCAAQNLCLLLHSQGLGTKCTTGGAGCLVELYFALKKMMDVIAM